jgi:excinuclease ABC subunit A
VDRVVIRGDQQKQLIASLEHGLAIGEGFLGFHLLNPEHAGEAAVRAFYEGFGCRADHILMGEPGHFYFGFNEPTSACVTCMGLGTYLQVHPDLLVPDRSRSIRGGAFIREAFNYDKNNWDGRIMWSLSLQYGFSLDTPFAELSPEVVKLLLYGTGDDKVTISLPEGATAGDHHVGRTVRFDGIITRIERRYRHYRKQGTAHTWMEEYLQKVMVEHTCPDCGGTRLKRQRLGVTVGGRNIHEVGEMHFGELLEFLRALPPAARRREVGEHVLQEITSRLELLLGIGLDYLSLNRKSGTLSGGESQRIRLSTQIGSGLMGMLYVLDEPSIGLHPKDNAKMIRTLQRLRDLGNTVIVVEHDEETIRAADHVIEMGPGPGVHGGEVVAQGSIEEILEHPASLTGQFLSGRRRIPMPERRRERNCRALAVHGARENNLKAIDVEIPLGLFVCVTGASGSGKSTLVNEILFKALYRHLHDSRVLPGEHDRVEGLELVDEILNIDQSPIGRSSRSNPVTYVGIYDDIRKLFAETEEARARGYSASRFSFNVKGGRCEECAGEGVVTTQLHFMPDVEVLCQACKGSRYNSETLEVTYLGKTIAEVLELSIEEGVEFFADRRPVRHKLGVMNELGLGYLKLGQSSTTLSGGEAQRVKLAFELGKIKRGGNHLYILDEPTTGLHLADIQRLLDSLRRLVDAGNTVVVIEHHLDVIKTADWIIDLGPEGGHAGGEVVAAGRPEEVAANPRSHTGQFLRRVLEAG